MATCPQSIMKLTRCWCTICTTLQSKDYFLTVTQVSTLTNLLEEGSDLVNIHTTNNNTLPSRYLELWQVRWGKDRIATGVVKKTTNVDLGPHITHLEEKI